MPTDVSTTFAVRLQVVRLLWLAETVALLLFGVVLWVGHPPGTADPTTFAVALGPVAVVLAGAVFFLRYRTMGGLGFVSPDDLRVEQHVEGPALGQALDAALGRYFVGAVIGMALAEAVAILGFVYAWSTGELVGYAPFGAFAAVLMAIQFPTRTGVMSLLTGPERKGLRKALEES